jgi:predicted TIM-barrel fold metal-dependent hydrolase
MHRLDVQIDPAVVLVRLVIDYDTAGSVNAAAIGTLLQLVTSKQVVFGSDYPFNTAPAVTAAISGLRTLGLSSDELGDMGGGNARGLFQRFAK